MIRERIFDFSDYLLLSIIKDLKLYSSVLRGGKDGQPRSIDRTLLKKDITMLGSVRDTLYLVLPLSNLIRAPTLHLGYSTTEQMKSSSSTLRYNRAKARLKRKRKHSETKKEVDVHLQAPV